MAQRKCSGLPLVSLEVLALRLTVTMQPTPLSDTWTVIPLLYSAGTCKAAHRCKCGYFDVLLAFLSGLSAYAYYNNSTSLQQFVTAASDDTGLRLGVSDVFGAHMPSIIEYMNAASTFLQRLTGNVQASDVLTVVADLNLFSIGQFSGQAKLGCVVAHP
jgi:hypothetical protein